MQASEPGPSGESQFICQRSSLAGSTRKAYPVTSAEINILYVMGLFAMPIARSERNAAWRFARRLKRKTNSSR
jgi:hypothetical protein